jgi:hypothetical protein
LTPKKKKFPSHDATRYIFLIGILSRSTSIARAAWLAQQMRINYFGFCGVVQFSWFLAGRLVSQTSATHALSRRASGALTACTRLFFPRKKSITLQMQEKVWIGVVLAFFRLKEINNSTSGRRKLSCSCECVCEGSNQARFVICCPPFLL